MSAPTGLAASDGSYTDFVYLSWSQSNGATSYSVYRNTSNSTSGATLLSNSETGTYYYDYNATAGTTYYYWVKATNSGGTSSYSSSNSGYRAIAAPSAPTGLSASDGSYTDFVYLSWSQSSGATSYSVYRNTSNSTSGATLLSNSETGTYYYDYYASAGTTYYYWVKASNSSGTSSYSSVASGYAADAAPPIPSGLTVSNGSYTDRVYLSWNASSGATVYYVYRNTTNSTSGADTLSTTDVGTAYNDYGATPGTTYYYFVRAANSSAVSGYSSAVSGYRAIAAPSAPTGLSASDGNYTDFVYLSWSQSNGATSYSVYRNTSNSTSGATLLSSSESGTSYYDYNATAGTTYYYWVKASNGGGTSGYSGSDSGYRAIAAPSVPTGLSASDGNYTDFVYLSWSQTSGATSYYVYRNTSNTTSGATLLSSSETGAYYYDYNVTAGTTYYYWVRASNGGGTSGYSTSDGGYRTLSAPTGVTATDGSSTANVMVTWTAASGATSYSVYRNTSNSTSGLTLVNSAVAGLSYSDTSAVAGTTYYYFVVAGSSVGSSGYSTADSGYRALTPPTGVAATDGSSTTNVTVTWTAATGATSYSVYRNTSNSTSGLTFLANTTSASYTDPYAVAGITYYYFVMAASSAGSSGYSTADSGYLALTPPTGVAATDGSSTAYVTVTWTAATGATSYSVYRNTSNSTSGLTLLNSAVAGLSYSDTSAVAGTTYYYFVMAVSSAGSSGYSTANSGYRAGSTYNSWIAAFAGLSTADRVMSADPDHDGLNNAVEMVLGGNPATVMNAALLPAVQMVTNPGGTVPAGDYLLFTYRRTDAAVAAGVTSGAEYSIGLAGTWTKAVHGTNGVIVVETNDAYATGIDQARVYIPRGTNARIFGRLRVEVP